MELTRWNPAKEPTPFSALFIASRRSGKSYLIRHLFEQYWGDMFEIVMVMCPTDFNHYYEEFIPGRLFFQEYNAYAIESLMHIQMSRIEAGIKPLRCLIILDDASDDREMFESLLQKLYTKGRHYHLSCIFSTQETTLTSTKWRNNSDFVCIGKQLGGRGTLNVIDNFLLGMADDDDIPSGMNEKVWLRKLMKKYTADHNFIVITFNSKQNDFKNTVQTYKALKEKKKKPRKLTKQEIAEVNEAERYLLDGSSGESGESGESVTE